MGKPVFYSLSNQLCFTGAGQKPVRVYTIEGCIEMIYLLPRDAVKAYRKAVNKILLQYLAGDQSLIEEIRQNAAESSPLQEMAREELKRSAKRGLDESDGPVFKTMRVEETQLQEFKDGVSQLVVSPLTRVIQDTVGEVQQRLVGTQDFFKQEMQQRLVRTQDFFKQEMQQELEKNKGALTQEIQSVMTLSTDVQKIVKDSEGNLQTVLLINNDLKNAMQLANNELQLIRKNNTATHEMITGNKNQINTLIATMDTLNNTIQQQRADIESIRNDCNKRLEEQQKLHETNLKQQLEDQKKLHDTILQQKEAMWEKRELGDTIKISDVAADLKKRVTNDDCLKIGSKLKGIFRDNMKVAPHYATREYNQGDMVACKYTRRDYYTVRFAIMQYFGKK